MESIKELVEGIQQGKKCQVLLGATGTGKTFKSLTISIFAFNDAAAFNNIDLYKVPLILISDSFIKKPPKIDNLSHFSRLL